MASTSNHKGRQRLTLLVLSGFAAGWAGGAAQWLGVWLVLRLLGSDQVALPAWLMRPEAWVALTAAWLVGGPAVGQLVLVAYGRRRPPRSAPAERLSSRETRGLHLTDGTPRLMVGPYEGSGGRAMLLQVPVAGVISLIIGTQVAILWHLAGDYGWKPVPLLVPLSLVCGVLSASRLGSSEFSNALFSTMLPGFPVLVLRFTLPKLLGHPADLPGAGLIVGLVVAANVLVVGRMLLDARRNGQSPSGFEQLVLTDRNVQVLRAGPRHNGTRDLSITVVERAQPLTFAQAGETVLVTLGERGRRVLLDPDDAEVLRAAARADGWTVVEADGWHVVRRARLAGRLRAVLVVVLTVATSWYAGRLLGSAVVLQQVVLPALDSARSGRLAQLPPAVAAVASKWPNDPVVQATVGLTCEALGDGARALDCWRAAARSAGAGSKIANCARTRLATGSAPPPAAGPVRSERVRSSAFRRLNQSPPHPA